MTGENCVNRNESIELKIDLVLKASDSKALGSMLSQYSGMFHFRSESRWGFEGMKHSPRHVQLMRQIVGICYLVQCMSFWSISLPESQIR